MKKFDIIVIGSGPGGYISAIRGSQLGKKVALVEKYSSLGGTCLNVGCIPSKAVLASSEHYHQALHEMKQHGVIVEPKLDFKKLMLRKQSVVKKMGAGVGFLMKKNNIPVFNGLATFETKNRLKIGDETIEADTIIIATGSKPNSLPNISIDKKRIISSTEALELKSVPKDMILIGGGVIGLEIGSVYARLGTKVTVIEYADKIIPTMDGELGKELQKSLEKIGIQFFTSHAVTAAKASEKKVTVTAQHHDKETTFEAEYCLVAVGRKPHTKGLGLEKIGIETDKRGFISVNENLQTSVKNIYAIGDVIGGAMLAHKAEEEGVFVAEYISGQKPHINYNTIPGVVYTSPEVSSVGKTEEELMAKKVPYNKGKYLFMANGRAVAGNETEGFVKVLSHKETDEILGVHMIGARTADLIAEAVLAMEYKASAEDIARTCHAHPTFSEIFKEASMGASYGKMLNS